MAGLRDQVISPVSKMEGEGRYSTPTGPRRDEVLDRAAGSLGATLEAMDVAVADPPRLTWQQTALAQALGTFGGAAPDDAKVGGARGKGRASIEAADGGGALKNPITLGGSFGGGPQEGPANVKLFRYDPRNGASFCGGLVNSSKKGPKHFCISTHCGLGHSKKVFDQLRDGDYYIIEPGPRGGGLSQTLRAYLEPSLPKAAAERSSDNKEVLGGINSMEGWLSLFRYLTDVEARGGGEEVNPGLVGFVARAQLSAFKTPLRDNSKRTRDAMTWDDEEELPPAILGLQDAIMGIQGKLGVRYPMAGYVTLHGGLKNLEEDVCTVQESLDAQLNAMHVTNQAEIGALKYEAAQASARSHEVKRWMEQTQATGRGTAENPTRSHQLQTEVVALRGRVDFLEGAFTQIATYITTLKDKVDNGGGSGPVPGHYVSKLDFDTLSREVQVALSGFRQKMKGAPLEFGGHSFQGLDSCVAWARTYMPENTYQCIPGMFYGLCLIRESVLYKQDI